MINLIIGVIALLIGGILGFFIGSIKTLKTLLNMIGISDDNFQSLKKEFHELANCIRKEKPQTEEEKEILREKVFSVIMKYSKYKLHSNLCVTIAHED